MQPAGRYVPDAVQLPAERQDMKSTPAPRPRSGQAARPRTAFALPHTPFRSVTTNACAGAVNGDPFSWYEPPAAQLPFDEHDTDTSSANCSPPGNADKPGTVRALP